LENPENDQYPADNGFAREMPGRLIFVVLLLIAHYNVPKDRQKRFPEIFSPTSLPHTGNSQPALKTGCKCRYV